MQTFLPFADFHKTAACLDYRRLGKQRVECLQLLKVLRAGPTTSLKPTPWYRHPAAQMWLGYENALVEYGRIICGAWLALGFKDICLAKIESLQTGAGVVYPPWLGQYDFHAAHRSNLLRKDFGWYHRFGWPEPADLPYIWPGHL